MYFAKLYQVIKCAKTIVKCHYVHIKEFIIYSRSTRTIVQKAIIFKNRSNLIAKRSSTTIRIIDMHITNTFIK